MLNQMFLRHSPNQSVGGHWHLAGSRKYEETGTPFNPGHFSHTTELVLVLKVDALSPHLSFAKTNQFLVPELTVKVPSGQQVNFHNVRVKKQTDTFELEEISFTFQKIEVTDKYGNKNASDDWLVG